MRRSGSFLRIEVLAWMMLLAVGIADVRAAEAGAESASPVAKAERPVRKFQLVVEKWTWSPETITVKRGTHVVLEIRSRDASRAFELKEFQVKASLPEGETVRVAFDADRAGTFAWRCSRPCGNGCAKLRGTLTVEE